MIATKRSFALAVAAAAVWFVTPGADAQSRNVVSTDQARHALLPWLVIDQNSHRSHTPFAPEEAPGSREAKRLSRSAQAVLDGQLHRAGEASLLPRDAWEDTAAATALRSAINVGDGCPLCLDAAALVRFDPDAIKRAGEAIRADYLWLGAVATPLTGSRHADECAQSEQHRREGTPLARAAVLLVRVSDGTVVWKRTTRIPERLIPHLQGKIARPPHERRHEAVELAARTLGGAFRRDGELALRK